MLFKHVFMLNVWNDLCFILISNSIGFLGKNVRFYKEIPKHINDLSANKYKDHVIKIAIKILAGVPDFVHVISLIMNRVCS